MQGDEFIDSIDLFVAAGERPEHRDALLILGDLRQGIKRIKEEFERLAYRSRSEHWDDVVDEGSEE